jgi:hypothetical protein
LFQAITAGQEKVAVEAAAVTVAASVKSGSLKA